MRRPSICDSTPSAQAEHLAAPSDHPPLCNKSGAVRLAIKVALLAGLVIGPSAVEIMSATSTAPKLRPIEMSFLGELAVAEVDGGEYDTSIELTQAIRRTCERPGNIGNRPSSATHSRGRFGFAATDGTLPRSRASCDEEVDRQMGLAAHLKAEMQLQDDQIAAWQKVEQAAASGADNLRDLCIRLPSQPARLDLLARIEFAEVQMSARLELLRAIHGPLQAFYGTLSSEQRELLTVVPDSFL